MQLIWVFGGRGIHSPADIKEKTLAATHGGWDHPSMKKLVGLASLMALTGCSEPSGHAPVQPTAVGSPSSPEHPNYVVPPGTVIVESSSTWADIPDRGELVILMIARYSGSVDEVSFRVLIVHPRRSDLHLELHGAGIAATLFHGEKGDDGGDLEATYTSADTPELARMVGRPIAGGWVITVGDRVAGKKGRLVEWELRVRTR